MRTKLPIPCLLLTLAASPGLLAQDLVRYDGGLWWNGESFVERSVFAREGVFRSASDREPDAVVDLDGGFVIPPLGDAHNHALGDPRFEAQRDALLAQGIFYLANPNNIARLTEAVRPHVNRPGSLDVIYSNGGLTGPGGHPMQIYDRMAAHLPGWSPEDMDGQAYFVLAGEADLDRRWPEILRGRPDFVKVMLEYSEEHAARRDDPAFYGRRGLDPRLLPRVVELAHGEDLRVVVHVSSAADVARAVASGADAVAHLPLERIDASTRRSFSTGGRWSWRRTTRTRARSCASWPSAAQRASPDPRLPRRLAGAKIGKSVSDSRACCCKPPRSTPYRRWAVRNASWSTSSP